MLIHLLRLLSIALTCLSAYLPANAQTDAGRYSVVNYNSDNALPQNSINGMAFDRALLGNEYALPQVGA